MSERTMCENAVSGRKVPRRIVPCTRAIGRRGLAAVALAAAFVITAPCLQAQTPASSSSAAPTSAKKKTPSKKHHKSRREPSQKAPTPDRISEIQSALSRNGFYDGNPNGKWDSVSVAAMQKFQSSNGLDATGKLDALSLQKLGLGSETAGVYAPETPHVPAAAASPNPPPSNPATTQPQ